MKVPKPRVFYRLVSATAYVTVLELCLSLSTLAQSASTDPADGRSSSGSLTVSIRNERGEPLTGTAIVRLYTADGIPVGQMSVVSGGQATFRSVRPGSYHLEVEASGYAKGLSDAFLPMSGGIDVQVYLHPEPAGDTMIPPDSEVPLLAPKAKKEVDAGVEALHEKDLDKAQTHLENAYKMAPSHPEVLYLLGSLYAQKSDLPRAEELLAKSTQMNPGYAPAQAALGITLSNDHKCRAALPPLRKAVELDAKAWEARWAIARCEYSHRNFQPALEQSKQALHDSNGLAPDIALVVAASQAALGQYEESASLLREYLQQHADRPGAARAKRWLDHLREAGKIKSN